MNIVHIENDSYCSIQLNKLLQNNHYSYYNEISASEIEDAIYLGGTFLYFIDFKTAIDVYKQIETLTESNKYCFTVIYDAPKKIATSELVKLGRLRGYFYVSTNDEEVFDSINRLLKGKSSLPENISYQLIEYYQSLILRFSEPYSINLTQREIQVLERLRLGLSNSKLADELFVSEHTVKSHLYKIFKKISVSKRTQAIAWAHKYLP
ncbi:LuxR C-terminal-related transcriptional regulator [Vibrio sp. DW001]|uniref:LuxR C-terminal-related transcriptional regulator n=1 Tax=Vibrio sp. DW001 TaxID=2912315 RepID=UPI0023AFA993|nr:LuxR C-terminal-related transcriptional regulator [Vibrio sp. DW001]WED26406.1 LuxR C-terminal-related transcriptional regulator [Vibrio sp. DW001]